MQLRLRPSLPVILALALGLGLLSAPAKAKKKRASAAAVRSDQAPDVVTYGQREDVMRFGAELAERRGLDVAWVQAALAQSRYVPTVARLIMPPPAGTAKNWNAYRARFVEPVRLRAGLAFWRANEAWLRLAEERYGVPPEIVVGIVGVETIYGQQMGSFRIIDALATLSFDFPSGRRDRSGFFRDELESHLVLCRQAGVDPQSWRGSYAGAVGMPQFMPSSILAHAVDFDGDGHVDLHGSTADVIGSVANFLAKAGWQRGLPTHYEVAVPVETSQRATLLGPDIVPLFSPEEFVELGALLPDAALALETSKLALIELQNGDAAPSYVAGTTNFYAITRYNWSSYYAMAVIALGEAVKKQL
ncbi:lytic murein transglycosylase B [Piscinibacter sp. XHJ-5]|uniref:lytic murein transglycosylase B n=1 Tax=Piscinibacter sp. XHJ-5 TaxID=3037797 RepID=UPI0024529582|nr:lytic murein transglycosylase B [Piscinibacter sp. XHJ-5]